MMFRFLRLFAAALAVPSALVDAKTTKLFAANVGHLVDARLDPLVTPGTCTGHVHSVYGNADFGKKLRRRMFIDNDWRNDGGKYDQTTSELIPNLSNYWVPSLYIQDPSTGTYHLVQSFVRTYYRIRHNPNDRSGIHPIPPFLRMIVGDASRKRAWATDEVDRDDIRWTLTTFNRKETNYLEHGDWSYLFDNADIAARSQVEVLLKFPDCLEVEDDGSPRTSSNDFRSHGAYSDNSHWDVSRQSFCPDSHPYQIPRLDLEVRFLLKPMRDLLGADVVNDARNWRLSTGDSSGAGAHADFVSGWPEEFMEEMIENCTDGESKDGVAHCILEDYNLDGRVEKTVPFEQLVPNEEVHEVSSLPSGRCPKPWVSY